MASRHLRAIVVASSLVAGCGGSGGGGGFDRSATLLSVAFPDSSASSASSDSGAPTDAPLVQRIVFTFSGRPDPRT